MKLSSVLVNLGGAALSTINPILGASAVALVNSFMDNDEDKVTLESTGQDALNRINTLPDNTRAKLLSQDVTLQIKLSEERMHVSDNHASITKLLNTSNTANTVVLKAANTVFMAIAVYGGMMSLITCLQVWLLLYSETPVDLATITALGNLLPEWEVVGLMLSAPVIIIYRFFGAQSKDTLALTNAMNGHKTVTVGETLKSLVRRKPK